MPENYDWLTRGLEPEVRPEYLAQKRRNEKIAAQDEAARAREYANQRQIDSILDNFIAGGGGGGELSPELQAMIEARIDQLDPDELAGMRTEAEQAAYDAAQRGAQGYQSGGIVPRFGGGNMNGISMQTQPARRRIGRQDMRGSGIGMGRPRNTFPVPSGRPIDRGISIGGPQPPPISASTMPAYGPAPAPINASTMPAIGRAQPPIQAWTQPAYGPAPGPTDTVPAMLTPGEGVLNTGAMRMIGEPAVNALNRYGRGIAMQGYAEGTSGVEGAPEIPEGYEVAGYPLGWYLRRMWEELRGRQPHLQMTDKNYWEHPAGDPYVSAYREERRLRQPNPPLRPEVADVPMTRYEEGGVAKEDETSRLAGTAAASALYRQLMDKYGFTWPEEQLIPDFWKVRASLDPVMAESGGVIPGFQGGTGRVGRQREIGPGEFVRTDYGPGMPRLGRSPADLNEFTGSYDNPLGPNDVAVHPNNPFGLKPGPGVWSKVGDEWKHVADYLNRRLDPRKIDFYHPKQPPLQGGFGGRRGPVSGSSERPSIEISGGGPRSGGTGGGGWAGGGDWGAGGIPGVGGPPPGQVSISAPGMSGPEVMEWAPGFNAGFGWKPWKDVGNLPARTGQGMAEGGVVPPHGISPEAGNAIAALIAGFTRGGQVAGYAAGTSGVEPIGYTDPIEEAEWMKIVQMVPPNTDIAKLKAQAQSSGISAETIAKLVGSLGSQFGAGGAFSSYAAPQYSMGDLAGGGGAAEGGFVTESGIVPGYAEGTGSVEVSGGGPRSSWGTGKPTRDLIGMGIGGLSNLLLPGLGFATSPLARYVTSLVQRGKWGSFAPNIPNAKPQGGAPAGAAPPPVAAPQAGYGEGSGGGQRGFEGLGGGGFEPLSGAGVGVPGYGGSLGPSSGYMGGQLGYSTSQGWNWKPWKDVGRLPTHPSQGV